MKEDYTLGEPGVKATIRTYQDEVSAVLMVLGLTGTVQWNSGSKPSEFEMWCQQDMKEIVHLYLNKGAYMSGTISRMNYACSEIGRAHV